MKREFAKLMLEYEEAYERLARLERKITEIVLATGETQVVGNVRATYRTGRKSYDYKAVCENAPEDVIEKFTKVRRSISWREVALSGLGMPKGAIPFSESEPSVRIKIEG